jgi:hypothetical protein
VKRLENDTAPLGLGSAGELAGYLALVPLLVCLAGVALHPDYPGRELAQRAAIAWGAVLFAFTGAVHWGLALAAKLPASAARVAAAPAVVAAAAILIDGQRALALLVIGFGVFWLYEHRLLGSVLPPAYLSLRRNLSLASCTLLALIMIASQSGGLL